MFLLLGEAGRSRAPQPQQQQQQQQQQQKSTGCFCAEAGICHFVAVPKFCLEGKAGETKNQDEHISSLEVRLPARRYCWQVMAGNSSLQLARASQQVSKLITSYIALGEQ